MAVRRSLIAASVLLSASSLLLAGTAVFPGQKHLRQWLAADGLPNNTILAAVHARSGYIWLGTATGLWRFDGFRFIQFHGPYPVLTNARITCLYEGMDSTIWIGTDADGIFACRDGHWLSYNSQNGLSYNQVQAITEDLNGNIWVGTSYGLNRIGRGNIRIYTEDDGLPDNIITSLYPDYAGRLWIGTLRSGLAYFDHDAIQPFGYREGLTVSTITALYTDRLGDLWVGSQKGLFVLDRRDLIFRQIPETDYTPVTGICEAPDGKIWIATMADGIKEIYGDSCLSFTPDNGFPDEYVHTLFFDEDTSLWIGTDSRGLLQWLTTPVSTIHLPDRVITGIVQEREGGFWAGTRNNGIFRFSFDRGQMIHIENQYLPKEGIKAIYQDALNRLWIVTVEGVILYRRNGLFSPFVVPVIRETGTVNCLAANGADELWIGTDRGLIKTSETSGTAVFLDSLRIHTIIPIANGNLLAGTSAGVWQVNTGSPSSISQLLRTADINVSALCLQPDSVLVIGSHGQGLSFLYRDSLSVLTSRNGLPDEHILSLFPGHTGDLWIGSYKGIISIPENELKDFIRAGSRYVRTIWFDRSDGMASRQCTAAARPGIAEDSNGRLFFATVDGIAWIRPKYNKQFEHDVNPVVEITDPDIPEVEDALDVNVTAFDYRAPEKLYFRFRLDAPNEQYWYLPAEKERKIHLTGLKAGKHRLLIEAAGNNSTWSEPPVVLSFTIPMPWYLQPSGIAMGTGILILIGLTGWFYQKTVIRHRRQNKYRTLRIDPERTADLISRLDAIMQREQPFLNPDLTIRDLAKALKVHPNHLSRIINENHGLGFNDYINRLRIEVVKDLFADPLNSDKTILELMYDAGFNSKSVFNQAFRKFTGVTPSAFRNRLPLSF
jgi:ligand-binding sensor domain-containing protein/AraC-like DNA-binding protein